MIEVSHVIASFQFTDSCVIFQLIHFFLYHTYSDQVTRRPKTTQHYSSTLKSNALKIRAHQRTQQTLMSSSFIQKVII